MTEFYDAFRTLDAERMAACYHPEARFSDPVFPELHGAEIGRMWGMLTTNARDLELTIREVTANDAEGSVLWEARYTFSKSRRPVHNVIQARFVFQDGLIIQHVDTFGFWRWSRMALGATGWLLGWSPLLRQKARRQAAAQLARSGRTSR